MRMASMLVTATMLAGTVRAVEAQEPAADPKDVGSIDAIVTAVYDVISGPAGAARNWDRWRSLFTEGARLMPTGRDSSGKARIRVMTPEDFVTSSGSRMEQTGFFEREVGRVTERYGNVVHLFSAYESRRAKEDPTPYARGINSFQLFFDGSRWWVVSIFWEGETPANPIPAKYLNK